MEISVQSLIASKTGKPAVELAVNGRRVQMGVADARRIGLQMIEAAEAAQSDAIVFELLGALDDEAKFGMIQAMRQKRAEQDDEGNHDE